MACWKVTYVNPDTHRRETHRDRNDHVVVYRTEKGAFLRALKINAAGASLVHVVPAPCKKRRK